MRRRRIVACGVAALLGLTVTAGPASAQRLWLTGREAAGVEVQAGGGGITLGGTAHTPGDAEYRDLFDNGSLGGVELRFNVGVAYRDDWRLDIVPFLRVDRARFDGQAYTDDYDVTYVPDGLRCRRFLMGVAARYRWTDPGELVSLWVAPQVGLGLATSDAVDGWLYDPLRPPERARLYEDTTSMAFDVGVRFGVGVRVVPVMDVGLVLGLGNAVQGAPNDVRSGSGGLAPADPDSMASFYVFIGVSVEFRLPRGLPDGA